MKINVITKLMTVWIATLLIVGGIAVSVWHTKQPKQVTQKQAASQVEQEAPQKSLGPSFAKQKPAVTLVQKPTASSPATASKEPVEAEEPIDEADWDVLPAELEKEPSVEEKPIMKEETAESNRTLEQQRLRELADAAMVEIPVLVEQWKEVMARRRALNSAPYSDARTQEMNHLTDERTKIEHRIIYLAMTYHSIHPEEGAIYYPEGKIGRLAKEVGLVFRRTPISR